jgi:hypothetical protein
VEEMKITLSQSLEYSTAAAIRILDQAAEIRKLRAENARLNAVLVLTTRVNDELSLRVRAQTIKIGAQSKAINDINSTIAPFVRNVLHQNQKSPTGLGTLPYRLE